MKSQDWQSQDNERAATVQKLIDVADLLGLDYEYDAKEFRLKLPTAEPVPIVPPHKSRKTFDTSTWGPQGIDETELPDGTELEEGETPEETK